MTQFTVPGMYDKEGDRGRRTAAEAAEPVQRPAPDAQACALERGRPELHRRARDDRPAGRVGARLRRRGRRADRGTRQVPAGTPGAILKDRTWDDYSVERDTVQAHLAALDLVYTGVIEDTRKCIDRLEDLDPVIAGHADRARRRAGEVPVVRPRPPGERRRPAGQSRAPKTEKGAARSAKKKAPVK